MKIKELIKILSKINFEYGVGRIDHFGDKNEMDIWDITVRSDKKFVDICTIDIGEEPD